MIHAWIFELYCTQTIHLFQYQIPIKVEFKKHYLFSPLQSTLEIQQKYLCAGIWLKDLIFKGLLPNPNDLFDAFEVPSYH